MWQQSVGCPLGPDGEVWRGIQERRKKWEREVKQKVRRKGVEGKGSEEDRLAVG